MIFFRTSLFLILILTATVVVADTRIVIEGMTRKSSDEVLSLMGGRLEHVRASAASPARADDAAFLVRQVLQKDGYVDVSVSWKITGRQEILLSVEEGSRLSLGQITVNGVPKDEVRKFIKLYSRPAEKDRPILGSESPFREGDVALGLNNIQQDLNAQGFWAATAEVENRATDPKTGRVDLTST